MNEWTDTEYEKILPVLEKLSLEDLKKIAKKTGIEFTEDKEMANITKEEILLVLDETDKDELLDALKNL